MGYCFARFMDRSDERRCGYAYACLNRIFMKPCWIRGRAVDSALSCEEGGNFRVEASLFCSWGSGECCSTRHAGITHHLRRQGAKEIRDSGSGPKYISRLHWLTSISKCHISL